MTGPIVDRPYTRRMGTMTDNDTVIIYVSGAAIAVVWLWFALLGIGTVGIMTALFVALAVTILLGALIGGLEMKKRGQ